MKFPKSMHAEGFYDHIETADTVPATPAPAVGVKAGLKPRAGARPLTGSGSVLREAAATPAMPPAEPLRTAMPPTPRTPTGAAAHVAAREPRARTMPWVLGTGVGVVLVGLAVVMARQLPRHEPAADSPTIVGQVTPSPEDAQLQSAPPSAGPDMAASAVMPAEPTEPAQPAATSTPSTTPANEPPVAVAQAPAPKASPEPKAVAPQRTEPAPVTRRLAPAPEVVAQATPPARLREPALQPVAPVAAQPAPVAPAPVVTTPAPVATPPQAQPTLPPVAAAPAVPQTVTPAVPPAVAPPATVPPEATPAVPPVAQQTPPATPDPEDTGITVKVRMALAADAALAAVPIAVSTDHGVVKLEGQAPDAQVRERATVVAASTTGVKGVDNRLTLPPVASLDRSTAVQNGG